MKVEISHTKMGENFQHVEVKQKTTKRKWCDMIQHPFVIKKKFSVLFQF